MTTQEMLGAVSDRKLREHGPELVHIAVQDFSRIARSQGIQAVADAAMVARQIAGEVFVFQKGELAKPSHRAKQFALRDEWRAVAIEAADYFAKTMRLHAGDRLPVSPITERKHGGTWQELLDMTTPAPEKKEAVEHSDGTFTTK